ncbi:MAG: YIP1 family protein [Pseudomonadota bacterium]
MSETAAPQGLVERVAGAYWDFSGSMRRLLEDQPREATLLSFLIVASLMRYAGQVVDAFGELSSSVAGEDFTRAFQTQVAEGFVGALILAPLAVYLFAAIAKPIAGALGGTGDWFETRAAFVWAYLVTAPIFLLRSAIDAIASSAGVPDGLLVILSLAFAALGLYVLGACLSVAHGFKSPRNTALVMAAGLFAIAGLAVALGVGVSGL